MKNKVFTLVGMSGCGKTHLAQKLSRNGAFHYSVDYEIANILRSNILESIINKIKGQSSLFKSLYESFALKADLSLVFDNLEVITTFVIPFGSEGTVEYKTLLNNQAIYKQAELQVMNEFSTRAKNAIGFYNSQGFICDTTGSICEVVLDSANLVNNLKHNSTVIYIKTQEEHKNTLIERSQLAVKPLLYNVDFLYKNLQEYYATSNIEDNFKIDKSFFIWVFNRLLAFRQKAYENLISQVGGITIDVEQIQTIETVEQLKSCVASKQY